jgi:hypothetical protein
MVIALLSVPMVADADAITFDLSGTLTSSSGLFSSSNPTGY